MISQEIYDKIINLAGISQSDETIYNDNEPGDKALETSLAEGSKKTVYGTRYERKPANRQQAINHHGLSCLACGLNFKEFYGEWGEGFIHVHHLKPLASVAEKHEINAKTDLTVLCANCHAMVHRRKDKLLSLEELRKLIDNQRRK